jgi:hypothetical protein
MIEQLKNIQSDILTGAQDLFQNALGFSLKPITNQNIPPQTFLKLHYQASFEGSIK